MTPRDWRPIRLGDVCTKIGSGATPKGGSKVYLEKGPVALIRSQNVHNDGFRTDGLAFITFEHAHELDHVEVLSGDVLLNVTGESVARCCQVPDDLLPARVNQHVAIIRPDPRKLWPGFLRYVLVSPQKQAELLSLAAAGATRAALTKKMIEDLHILAPASVAEQRAIAAILGALDAKIERLRRMNQILEAIARALFKSWFVDFELVKASVFGDARYRLAPEILALFPSSFENHGLAIPEGWEIKTLGDIASVHRETVNPSDYPDELFAHYSFAAYDSNQVPVIELGASIRSTKAIVTSDCILVSKLNPHFPRIWLPWVHSSYRSVASTEFVVLEPKAHISREMLYLLLSQERFLEFLRSRATGTSGSHQRVRVEDLLNYDVVVPPKPVVSAFQRCIEPIMVRIALCRREAQILAELRDTLLPRLISGQLRIPDAERMLVENL